MYSKKKKSLIMKFARGPWGEYAKNFQSSQCTACYLSLWINDEFILLAKRPNEKNDRSINKLIVCT